MLTRDLQGAVEAARNMCKSLGQCVALVRVQSLVQACKSTLGLARNSTAKRSLVNGKQVVASCCTDVSAAKFASSSEIAFDF